MVGVWVRMLVYLHRSGKWSVNHNMYILVYIEHGSRKQGK